MMYPGRSSNYTLRPSSNYTLRPSSNYPFSGVVRFPSRQPSKIHFDGSLQSNNGASISDQNDFPKQPARHAPHFRISSNVGNIQNVPSINPINENCRTVTQFTDLFSSSLSNSVADKWNTKLRKISSDNERIENIIFDNKLDENKNIREMGAITSEFQKPAGRQIRHLIGTVEYVIQWYQLIQNTDVYAIYQVIGTLECVKDGKYWCEKVVFIRGEGGSILQGIYYEIDRVFPILPKGLLLLCTGRMIGANKLHIFSTQLLTEEDKIGAHRAIFLSQRTVNELASD